MAKTTIKGRFATAADAATVHQISEVRREWLDREIGKATGAIVLFTQLTSTATEHAPDPKAGRAKRSGKTARLRAKKK